MIGVDLSERMLALARAEWSHPRVTFQRASMEEVAFPPNRFELGARVMVPRGHTRFVSPLNTHTPAALYEAFPPAEAGRVRRKLEFHYTPVHGSWLNMAEIEFSLLARQCLNRRIGDRDTLVTEVAAWEAGRNEQRATIRWQFTVDDARRRLHRLDPS